MPSLRFRAAGLLLVASVPFAAPVAAQEPENEAADEQVVEAFVFEPVDVDRKEYELNPETFDLQVTTFTEVGWMQEDLQRQRKKAVIREAFAAADLREAESYRTEAIDELDFSKNRLESIAASFSSAAVEGFLSDLSGDLNNVIAPDLDEIANASLSDYTTEQILIDRVAAEGAVVKAESQLERAEAAVVSANSKLERANAEVATADEDIAALELRVEEHASIALTMDREAAGLGESFAALEPAEGQLVRNSEVQLASVAGLFKVNVQIEDQLDALIAHARVDGLAFGGGAYRTVESQIALRIAHCGGGAVAETEPLPEGATPEDAAAAAEAAEAAAAASRHYAIYEAPAGSCSPPTAIPGQSEHQTGLAIDFTDGAGNILTWGSPHFAWLSANAHLYGLYNLPSEAWHWSTTGH